MMIAPGVMLGSHRIVALLGRGGMATVYEAFDTRLERAVALKVLPPQFLHDETFARRFDQEARVIAKLEHPAIVPIYACGTDDGIPWMSMRLLGGGNMGTLLKNAPPDPVKALGILRRVAEALDYAHVRGVVHRDIKPANILFDRDGRACVGDFGLAQMLEGNPVVTRTGTVVGTPHYMAPEQALGNRLDHRCDVYSLGIVAYEMLFGRTPFTGDSPVAVLLKHVNEPLPVPAASRLPDALLRAIQKAAAKDPFERWPSAGAFAEALDTSLGVARISTTSVQRSAYERAEQHSEPRPGRLTIAAAAVLGTAALAWALVMPQPEPPREGGEQTTVVRPPDDKDGGNQPGPTVLPATACQGGERCTADQQEGTDSCAEGETRYSRRRNSNRRPAQERSGCNDGCVLVTYWTSVRRNGAVPTSAGGIEVPTAGPDGGTRHSRGQASDRRRPAAPGSQASCHSATSSSAARGGCDRGPTVHSPCDPDLSGGSGRRHNS